MTFDHTKNGTVGRLAAWAAVLALAFTFAAAMFSGGTALKSIESSLDRNCRIIVALDTDTRILILLHASRRPDNPRIAALIERAIDEGGSSERC